jgi:hypothetical protein
MTVNTEVIDFSLPKSLVSKLPSYLKLEKAKTKTDMPCLPFKSRYTVKDATKEVTWLAVWISPEFQYDTQLLQNSLVLKQPAIAFLPDCYMVRKPYQWDCLISQNKEGIEDLLMEVYHIPEEAFKGILEKS